MEDGDADDERRGSEEPPLPSDDESDESPIPTDPVAEADADRETDEVTSPGPAPAGGNEDTVGSHATPTESESSAGLFDRDASDIAAAVPADVPTDWGKSTPSPAGGSATPTHGGGNAPTYDPDEDIVDEARPTTRRCPSPTTSRRWRCGCSSSSA